LSGLGLCFEWPNGGKVTDMSSGKSSISAIGPV